MKISRWLLTATLPLLPWVPLSATLPVQAGTCASQCGAAPLAFEPGRTVRVELWNGSANIVLVQEAGGSDPIPVAPGQILRLNRLATTVENASVTFWDTSGLAVKASLKKVQGDILEIKLTPDYESPGDGAVYLRDDGRVDVF